jgi:hypothetical protein
MGLYPALARMIYRGDVKQGDVISTRKVSLQELRDGKPDFLGKEQAKQTGDVKEYQGLLPNQALAAGRVQVEFTETPQASVFPDMKQFITDDAIVSNTGQLTWYPARAQDGHRGYFTVNTDGTKAAVGFLPKGAITTLQSQTPFAGLFLTALDRDANLKTGKRLLLTAMARVRNTGQKFSEDGKQLLEVGTTPMLIEPVKAQVRISGRTIKAVRLLDHDGRQMDATLKASGDTFAVDGAQDKTFYYLVEME